MTSWRHDLADEAVSDIEELLEAGLVMARDLLGRYGEYAPFGIVIDHDAVPAIEATEAEPGHGGAADALDQLWRRLADARHTLRAVAAVVDSVDHDGDAIRVTVEHEDGRAVLAVQHYVRRAGGLFGWGEVELYAAPQRVWSPLPA